MRADPSRFYINNDDGYMFLYHLDCGDIDYTGGCVEPLDSSDSLADILRHMEDHTCDVEIGEPIEELQDAVARHKQIVKRPRYSELLEENDG